jgi:hypothetical protein
LRRLQSSQAYFFHLQPADRSYEHVAVMNGNERYAALTEQAKVDAKKK